MRAKVIILCKNVVIDDERLSGLCQWLMMFVSLEFIYNYHIYMFLFGICIHLYIFLELIKNWELFKNIAYNQQIKKNWPLEI